MHQSVLGRCSSCQPRLHFYFCYIHLRRLSTAASVPLANNDQHPIETWEPWQDSSAKAPTGTDWKAKDVIVHDLSATLESHRASNRAAVTQKNAPPIRKIRSGPIVTELENGPVLEQDSDGGRESQKINEGKEGEPFQGRLRLWPLDSVQAQRQYGGKNRRVKEDAQNDVLEYTAVAFDNKGPWRLYRPQNSKFRHPWMNYVKTAGRDNLEQLTREIKAYEAYMRLSPREEAASELVISDVNSVARYNGPEMKPLALLGSRSTGLATPISDFDFSFTPPNSLPGGWVIPPSEDSVSQPKPCNKEVKAKAVKALRKVQRQFLFSSKFCNTEFVMYARVPIIRSIHVDTGLRVQIQTMAPYQASREYTMAYLSEYPSLRPLYIILRYGLELRNLTTVFEGGLGSYSIIMMIVTALKHSSGKFASDDLGGQLLHVLDFYGSADLYKFGFSADPPRTFEKQAGARMLKEQMSCKLDSQLSGIDLMQTFYPRKPYLLCLQDPANNLNDLGKNAYAIKHIQATFCNVKQRIQTYLEHEDKDEVEDEVEDEDVIIDGKTHARMRCYLGCFLGANYRPFELRRSRVERYAEPTNLDDRVYSNERILRDYEKRVNEYTSVAEEEDNLKPSPETINGNVAETVEMENRVNGGTRSAWGSRGLAHTRNRNARSKLKETIAVKEQAELQRLSGTNDNGFGRGILSLTDQLAVLEDTAVYRLALAVTTAAPKQLPHPLRQSQDRDKQNTPGLIRIYYKKVAKPDPSPARARALTKEITKTWITKTLVLESRNRARKEMSPPTRVGIRAMSISPLVGRTEIRELCSLQTVPPLSDEKSALLEEDDMTKRLESDGASPPRIPPLPTPIERKLFGTLRPRRRLSKDPLIRRLKTDGQIIRKTRYRSPLDMQIDFPEPDDVPKRLESDLPKLSVSPPTTPVERGKVGRPRPQRASSVPIKKHTVASKPSIWRHVWDGRSNPESTSSKVDETSERPEPDGALQPSASSSVSPSPSNPRVPRPYKGPRRLGSLTPLVKRKTYVKPVAQGSEGR